MYLTQNTLLFSPMGSTWFHDFFFSFEDLVSNMKVFKNNREIALGLKCDSNLYPNVSVVNVVT